MNGKKLYSFQYGSFPSTTESASVFSGVISVSIKYWLAAHGKKCKAAMTQRPIHSFFHHPQHTKCLPFASNESCDQTLGVTEEHWIVKVVDKKSRRNISRAPIVYPLGLYEDFRL